MYENMVDVLIYLYENYMDGESKAPTDQGELEEELAQAGFTSREIQKALHWLDELAAGVDRPQYHAYTAHSMRLYSEGECEKLDVEARGLLLFLEQSGILDPVCRELVIERALAIDHPAVSVEELKWIVLLVLMNRPGHEVAFSQMEDLVYNDDPAIIH